MNNIGTPLCVTIRCGQLWPIKNRIVLFSQFNDEFIINDHIQSSYISEELIDWSEDIFGLFIHNLYET